MRRRDDRRFYVRNRYNIFNWKSSHTGGPKWIHRLCAGTVPGRLLPFLRWRIVFACFQPAANSKCYYSEFWQRDGEHGGDADVDADVDWDVSGDGELCCDHWSWLYDRSSEFPIHTEPDAIGDATGAVQSDGDRDSQWSDHDLPQLNNG